MGQRFSFQYPLRGARSTFCSFSSKFSAVTTASERLKLFSQVFLAHDHVSGRKRLVDIPAVAHNFVGKLPELFFLLAPCTFDSRLLSFKSAHANGGNPQSAKDQYEPPVQCYPRTASGEGICHGESDVRIRWEPE